ncbi:TPA: magnesium transporter [archaeon]|nr:magnesium transporter [Candidatus Naiadarchaeales archaeon SRR2090159.bin1288]
MSTTRDINNVGFTEYLQRSRKTLKQAFSSLFLTILTSVLAGIILASSRDILLATPGLIILVPAILSMRGTIQGALGSRLGSALHLGLIKRFNFRDPIVQHNLLASILLSSYLAVMIAVFSKVISALLGIESIGIFSLISISFVGSTMAMLILLYAISKILFIAHRRGWDIDTIQAPLVSSFGDFVTIPSLLLSATALGFVAPFHFTISVLIVAFLIASIFFVWHLSSDIKRILKESLPILAVSVTLSAIAGVAMQGNLKKLVELPAVLALIPAFSAQGGNIGSVFASRLSSEMHLGLIKPKFKVAGYAEHEISHTYLLSLFSFPLIGALTYAIAVLAGLPVATNPMLLVFVSLVAGAILSTVVVFSTFYLSIKAYRSSIDPDNILIPIVAGMADVLGIVCLFVVLHIMGVI